jgi:hypothetical protein
MHIFLEHIIQNLLKMVLNLISHVSISNSHIKINMGCYSKVPTNQDPTLAAVKHSLESRKNWKVWKKIIPEFISNSTRHTVVV